MMAGLFFLFFVALLCLVKGQRTLAIWFAVITLILCAGMLYYHATDTLGILL